MSDQPAAEKGQMSMRTIMIGLRQTDIDDLRPDLLAEVDIVAPDGHIMSAEEVFVLAVRALNNIKRALKRSRNHCTELEESIEEIRREAMDSERAGLLWHRRFAGRGIIR